MDLKKHRDKKFEGKTILGPNQFAIDCFEYINHNNIGKKILDIGCGSGRDSIYFAQQGLNVHSLDISTSGINALKKYIKENKLDINLHNDDMLRITFEENSFDIVYANLSLHYFNDSDTDKIFNNIYKILRPGGCFFVRCKSTSDNLHGKGIKIENNMFDDNGHIRHFFNVDYMQSKLKNFNKVIKNIEVSEKHTTINNGEYIAYFIEAIAQK